MLWFWLKSAGQKKKDKQALYYYTRNLSIESMTSKKQSNRPYKMDFSGNDKTASLPAALDFVGICDQNQHVGRQKNEQA